MSCLYGLQDGRQTGYLSPACGGSLREISPPYASGARSRFSMDSFELNKILGAVLGTCLILLALNITANALFSPPKLEKPGYDLPMPEVAAAGEKGGAAAAPDQPIETLLASS